MGISTAAARLRSIVLTLLAWGWLSLAPASAHAGDVSYDEWRETFEPQALALRFPIGQFAFVVTAGGNDGRDRELVAAFLDALVASGKARKIVEGGTGLHLPGRTDADLVEALRALRFDLAVVLRLLPPAQGHDETSLVTVMSPSGRVVSRFVARRGQRLERGIVEPPLPPEIRSGQETRPSPDRSVPSPWSEAETLYSERRIFLGHPGVAPWRAGSSTEPALGSPDHVLSPEQLYRMIGGDELAWEYRTLRTRRFTLLGIGVAGTVVSYLAAALMLSSHTANRDQYAAVCLVAHGLSAGLMISTATFAMEPLGAGEVRRAVADYNRRLRDSLGLPPEPPVPAAEPAPPQWSLIPAVSSAGGGLLLSGRF